MKKGLKGLSLFTFTRWRCFELFDKHILDSTYKEGKIIQYEVVYQRMCEEQQGFFTSLN